MGSSRSTSQDTDNSDHSTIGGGTTATHHNLQHHQQHGDSGNANDAQQQPLLQSHQFHSNQRSPNHSSGTLSLAESNTTLDSTAYSSSGSLNGNGDQRNLLPNNAANASVTRSRSGDMSFGLCCLHGIWCCVIIVFNYLLYDFFWIPIKYVTKLCATHARIMYAVTTVITAI